MIFPFIPFLLEALVYVNNQTLDPDWNIGPEYTFKINKTTRVFVEATLPEEISAIVRCRKAIENVHICYAYKIIFSNISQETYEYVEKTGMWPSSVQRESYKLPDQFFEIEFGMRGVHSFRKNKARHSPFYDIVPDIVEQFNVDISATILAADVVKKYEDAVNKSLNVNYFSQQDEDTIKFSTCDTQYKFSKVLYVLSNHSYKDEEFPVRKSKTKSHFHLRLTSHTKLINSYVSIKRKRIKCLHTPHIIFGNKKWELILYNFPEQKIPLYYTTMVIRSRKPKFTSHTYAMGHVFLPHTKERSFFIQDVHLVLLRIKPVKLQYYPTEYEDKIIIKSEMTG